MLQLMLAATLALFAMQGANPIPVQCISESNLRERLSAELPQLRWLSVPRNRIEDFVEAFNALPPRTDAKADAALIITMPAAPQAVVAFFREGCLVSRASLPTPLLERVLRAIAEEA